MCYHKAMNNMTHEQKEKLLFAFSFIIACLSVLVSFVFIAVQTYVRWKINQNFTFLGGAELEVLTASGFALLIALLYMHRPKHTSN